MNLKDIKTNGWKTSGHFSLRFRPKVGKMTLPRGAVWLGTLTAVIERGFVLGFFFFEILNLLQLISLNHLTYYYLGLCTTAFSTRNESFRNNSFRTMTNGSGGLVEYHIPSSSSLHLCPRFCLILCHNTNATRRQNNSGWPGPCQPGSATLCLVQPRPKSRALFLKYTTLGHRHTTLPTGM